jgi:hypothetical protein
MDARGAPNTGEKQHLRGVQVPSHPPPKGGGLRRGGTRAPHAGGKFTLI